MPEMVFEYILKKNEIDPQTDLNINQGIDFGSTAAAFQREVETLLLNSSQVQPLWKWKEKDML